jgi:hypothetical protein
LDSADERADSGEDETEAALRSGLGLVVPAQLLVSKLLPRHRI